MKSARRLLDLSPTERRLVLKAAFMICGARAALWLLPFRTVRDLLDRAAKPPSGTRPMETVPPGRIARLVEATSRNLPGLGTCLTQALTARVLLIGRGYPAVLRIGVVKGENGALEAHAWVESGGEVVIGGYDLERYVPFANLEGSRA